MPEIATFAGALSALPEPLQAPTARWLDRLTDGHRVPDGVDSAALVRVVALSDFAANVLLRDWDWFAEAHTSIAAGFDPSGLARFADGIAASDAAPDEVKSMLRRERHRRLLSTFWRDATGHAAVDDVLLELSEVADQLLRAAVCYAGRRMVERHGTVRNADGDPVHMLVIGMGKLGGGELNFSSDIDIIFAYPETGESDGRKPLAAQPYFDRLSRYVIGLLDDVTADGFVYRTDTRLRPFGESGPPVISFAALESYLLQHGRAWERYAYVKARCVGPAVSPERHAELFDQLIRPFVYRGYLDFGVFESLRDLHGRIAAEVSRRELANNIKLGPGGIREIEFIVQSLQLVRGGTRPELQTPSLLEVLPRLVGERGLGADAVHELGDAYRMLRRAENFLQAMRDQQTHDLPADAADRVRLCLALGFADVAACDEALRRARASVQQYFDDVAVRAASDRQASRQDAGFDRLWRDNADPDAWQEALVAGDFAGAAEIAASLVSFQRSSAVLKLGRQAADRLGVFVPRLLAIARECPDAALAVRRCLDVLGSILRRSAYLALLNENSDAASRFVRLCAESAYIAAELARFPVLLDELLEPGLLSAPVRRDALAQELEARMGARMDAGSEEKMEVLAQFQRATMFRIAVSDFSGAMQVMQVSDGLTWLAEAILERALGIAWDELVLRHGKPCYRLDGERRAAGFGIIAYGKLGGLELSYGSDLDVVFLHDSRGEDQNTDGAKPLDNAMFFARLVRRLVHFMSTRTSTGALYEIDTRLRPSGRKGLLVSSTEAFHRYQEENAWTWEHQALLRARPVAGSRVVAHAFEQIREDTLRNRVRRETLRQDVLAMRQRMRRELDDSDADGFNLKHGAGGIGDIEFIVQYLVLDRAAEHPSVIEFTDNVRQLNALAECGALPLAMAAELQKSYRAYRRRQHRLALNDEPGRVPDAEFAEQRALVERCWRTVFGT